MDGPPAARVAFSPMTAPTTARRRPSAAVPFACQPSLAGVVARRLGWHLVVDDQPAVCGYPSEHPVGVPV